MNELDFAFNLLEPFTATEWIYVGICFLLLMWLAWSDDGDYK
jgi:hypothetical protein